MNKQSEVLYEEPTKAELERQMEETRDSLSRTVKEIKETVNEQVTSVKQGVSGVLDYREQLRLMHLEGPTMRLWF